MLWEALRGVAQKKSGGEAGASPPDQCDTAMESKADIEL
jgi:hypothetical protein